MPQQRLDYQTPSRSAKAKMGPLAVGAVVLLPYPFCLVANLMSLAAAPAPGENVHPLALLAFRGFLWGGTFYPAVYLVAAGISVFLASNERSVGARRAALAPLLYLGGLILCLLASQIIAGISG